jgi:hypothetical protein
MPAFISLSTVSDNVKSLTEYFAISPREHVTSFVAQNNQLRHESYLMHLREKKIAFQ